MKLFKTIYPALPKEKKVKFILRRVRINNGGYDSTGTYWGNGSPLYWAQSEEEFDFGGNYPESLENHFRAANRQHAKELIKKEIPNASFYG
jgi:hypothetical protein